MVIFVQKIVKCRFVINRFIDNKKEESLAEGKGYYKNENGEITVFFSSDGIKYKYVYKNDCLIVNCNDSIYKFIVGEKDKGIIKSDDYEFSVITLASKIVVSDNSIVLEYCLYQESLIGSYKCFLSFN